MEGGAGEDRLYGQEGNDQLLGGTQNDQLDGGDGDDNLLGQDGDDTLYGRDGQDTLDGGAGSDRLDGGAGNDTYVFAKGGGKDVISSYDPTTGKVDTIQLGSTVTVNNLVVERDGDALVLSIKNTSDELRVSSYFHQDGAGGYQVERIRFADATVWDVASVKSRAMAATAGRDTLIGYATADAVFGAGGEDLLSGRGGNDTLDGGVDADQLFGEDGDDVLRGGTQADQLDGGLGQDNLLGQDGDDRLFGQAGNDTLDGGAGADTLDGGAGHDVYAFARGSGKDVITGYDTTPGKTDVVQFGSGIEVGDTSVSRDGNALVLAWSGTSDSLRISDYFHLDAAGGYQVEQIRFADGTTWTVDDVKARALAGTADGDRLTGYATSDVMEGVAGDDTISGRGGHDTLDGGAGEDRLFGDEGDDLLRGGFQSDLIDGGSGQDSLLGQGDDDKLDGREGQDTLDGGSGNDTLDGGAGDDIYVFGAGAGRDVIDAYDAAVGMRDDRVVIEGAVDVDQLWMQRTGQDLELTLLDTRDRLTVRNWYSGDAYRVDAFQLDDGRRLVASQVDVLVSAMAAFEVPAPGNGAMTAHDQAALGTLVAASWTAAQP